MQSKRIYSPELKRIVRIRVSAKELRTIDKIGLSAYLNMRGVKVQDLVRE